MGIRRQLGRPVKLYPSECYVFGSEWLPRIALAPSSRSSQDWSSALLTLRLMPYVLCIFGSIACFTTRQYAGLAMFRQGYSSFGALEFPVIFHMSLLCGLLGQVAP